MKQLIKRFYFAAVNYMIKSTFLFWQKIGIHVSPNHYYHPIPDTRDLNDKIWSENSQLVGINLNAGQQINLLSKFSANYKDEYERFPLNKTSISHQFHVLNGALVPVDSYLLYCMVRYYKPARIIEVGSGHSTFLMAHAINRCKDEDNGYDCELVAIEPFPCETLRRGFPGLTRLIPEKVQDVQLNEFSRLTTNDILFIDSTHVLKAGSDVKHEYLEILPRLNKGVLVHIHDIFLPAEYPRDWLLKDFRFWNEQYLLQAFLTFNDSFEVIWAGNYMRMEHPEKLEAAIELFKTVKWWPGSFWIRKVK